jgi:glutamate dehydrogenase/leucine dehydrogenase
MSREPEEVLEIVDPPSGLHALLVIDDTTLGPAAGRVRTRAYPTPREAGEDARRLARAMTIKCALAGLDAGGGKCVVIAAAGLDRPRAFAALGRRVEDLGGRFRTAGDFGTTEDVHVPDVIASAGAVADGIGRTVMGLADRTALIDALGATASEVLAASRTTGRTPEEEAQRRAETRIAAARIRRGSLA